MNKRIKVLVTASIVSTFVIPASYASGIATSNEKYVNNKIELSAKNAAKEKVEEIKGKKDKKESKNEKNKKHLENMTSTILKRLEGIEKETLKIEEQINSYFETGMSAPESEDEANSEEQADGAEEAAGNEEVVESPGEDNNETVSDTETIEASTGTENQSVTNDTDAEEVGQDKLIDEEETTEEVTEELGDTEELEEAEEISEEDKEELEEIEEEFEEEDNSRYNSFYGKLNAQLNKLNSVTNKLDALSNKYSDDNEGLQSAYDKIEEMKAKIDQLINSVDEKQGEIVKHLRENKNKKVLEQKEDVEENKTWQITFSRELDSETVNGENIVVSDAEGNIAVVDLNYDSENKQVIIECKEGFEPGKTYYLNISTNVKSAEGNNLSEAIEMGFTVK
ncbi:hypothetical protein GOM49_15690 [Clostridium bovifaecis]|uniref:SbsA Ig-like domain-containing protein n=1 Tax=Clostridium bovifaecis TaxID=2184719 RepID=A0A6I6F556_9CLOT|nr:hypothetical protein GOM49_15690 [Clostridium bovifaecis]